MNDHRRRAMRDLIVRYATKFGVVGGIGFAIDVGLFNALRFELGGNDPILESSFSAKAISVSVATLVTWFGNRLWTFRDRRRGDFILEMFEFAGIAVVGMGIALGCLYVSRYWFGFDSLFADNIASNVVGLGLGTTFRFLMYRYWVYGDGRKSSKANLERTSPAAIVG